MSTVLRTSSRSRDRLVRFASGAVSLTATIAACLLPDATAAHAATSPRYGITDLGSLSSTDVSAATAINNAGVVVGYSSTASGSVHGFRWTRGSMTDLGTLPGGGFSRANAINDAGQIAGTADRTSGGYGYPVRWSATGAIQDLGGPITNRLGVGNGIDPRGRVAGGQRAAGSEGGPNAILYDQAGTPTDLGNPPDSVGPANGINARGQVVGGGPAFVWQNGALTSLPGLPGGAAQATIANAINTEGDVVGAAAASNSTQHAVLWRRGAAIDVGTVDGIAFSQATGINDAGQVVGTSDPGCVPCPPARAWFWQAGVITPLDSLVPSGSGWTLTAASGINARGQIVGTGVHNGHQHGFLLTPRFHANVNFQPAGAPTPSGYTADTGATFGVRSSGKSYGWDRDNSANTRDRNAITSPDQRYDTLNHLQKSGGATRWEIAVPNGRYTIHVVAGDPIATDSTFRIKVEGVLAVSGTPSSAARWLEGTVSVLVSDGRLTVTNASGAVNNKINDIDVING